MAGPPELLNFVNKFLNLLNCGQNARLTVEIQGGKATVNLQLDLEPLLPNAEAQQHGRPRQHAGPSRLRRQAARAQAREQAAAEAASYAEVAARVTISSTSPVATAAAAVSKEAVAEEAVAEEATKDTNENAKMHSSTEQVKGAEESDVSERFNDIIKNRDETIEELKEKVANLTRDNLELKERVMVTQMFYDGFRDEMRNKFGYDSGEDAEEHWQELLKKDQLEQEQYSCDKCDFATKTEAGLKIHGTKKHRGK